MRADADHWVISHLELTRAAGNGMRSSGSHNVFDSMVFSYNGGTGFQLSGSGDPEEWPAHNLVTNSTAHDNRDPADINADGYNADSNVGTGFKVGGEGLLVDHVLTGNLAYANNLDGFSDNFNPGQIQLTNNTAVDNKRFNFIFRTNPYFEPHEQGVFRNNLSVFTTDRARADQISGDADSSNVLFNGTESRAEGGKRLVFPRDFVSLEQPDGHARAEDGSLIFGEFAQPTFRSILVDGGTDGDHIGAIDPAPHPSGKR